MVQNWRFWCKNESFWSIVGARNIAAPRIGERDNEAGIMSIWGPSLPHILQIRSLHQFATGTPSHVPNRRRGIIIAIFRGFGTNCMVPSDWDLAPWCVCVFHGWFCLPMISTFCRLFWGLQAQVISTDKLWGKWLNDLFKFVRVLRKKPLHF